MGSVVKNAIRVLLPAVLFLGGCASTTEVTTRTVTETPPPPPETLLLVARSPEGDTRETWELTCRPIFERAGLTVLLSHQEVPLWYERGRKALVEWTADHPVDRILMVDLTRLLMSAPHLRDRQELNPINQEHEVRPTWRVGLDGERIKDTPPADVEQTFPADLLSGDGDSLWHGVARTHEANDQTAIAKSQCLALRDTLRRARLLP